jgi:hypothetical protein
MRVAVLEVGRLRRSLQHEPGKIEQAERSRASVLLSASGDAVGRLAASHLSLIRSRKDFGKKENLTLKRLSDLVDAGIRAKAESLISLADEKCAFAHNWRNRRIAHRDLALALKENAMPLCEASRKSVRKHSTQLLPSSTQSGVTTGTKK